MEPYKHFFNKHCKNQLYSWNLKEFEKTHPALLNSILSAMREVHERGMQRGYELGKEEKPK